MTIWGESSDAVQIFGAFFSMVGALGVAYIAYLTARMNKGQQDAALHVQEVKETLQQSTDTTHGKINDMAADVDVVKKQTNGMLQKLEDVAFAAGKKSEKDHPTS